ncbi:hypothetical protein Q31a_57190 [Aureliella helgolandensis]|uniref:Ice-binding protein C-terminal domain-containing protein n=2 Tax=Aureliella helgolandensis TaxID=2527968 RepID=A0A518GFF5_9BACT|nr:hypothetical protein Q31a_57190 [Aureliella helgolandensis]
MECVLLRRPPPTEVNMEFLAMRSLVLSVIVMFATSVAHADVINVDVSGWQAVGGYTAPGNSFQTFDLGPSGVLSDVSWTDLDYDAPAPSNLSELVFNFTNSDRSQSWQFTVSGTTSPGNYFGSGNVFTDKVAGGVGPVTTLADGILRFEVYDSFNDRSIPVDQIINSGTFNLTVSDVPSVPEPSSAGLAGLVLLASMWRRSRQ